MKKLIVFSAPTDRFINETINTRLEDVGRLIKSIEVLLPIEFNSLILESPLELNLCYQKREITIEILHCTYPSN